MGLEIYMLGVIVGDMRRAVEFYRRLGLAIPDDAENKEHVRVRMGRMTFFLNTEARHATVDPTWSRGTGDYRIIVEFNLGTREAVDAKYAEMIGYGYRSHRPPFDATPAALHFAMIDDPDGNTVLLSAV
jgi:predicted lactoylglutathione lyase